MRIELFMTAQGWMARHIGDSRISQCFGTNVLPTAFTAEAEAHVVLREITRLNPSSEVSLVKC
jgi:hypothetical protein